MEVILDNGQVHHIHATLDSINEWWIQSTSHIYKSNRLIYLVEIDGQPMYTGYEQFIIENYRSINQIRIVTKSHQDSIVETLSMLKAYLTEFIPKSEEISAFWYGDISAEQWNQFSVFIEGLNWIVGSLEFLKVLNIDDNVIMLLNNLEAIIKELDQKLQVEDYVGVGDLISYELIPVLQRIEQLSDRQENYMQ
ncbi:hypothetical protein M3G15_12315 [Paenibacillus sp. p3-SID1389]|jgi:hypothetical protein|uniref:hypothetical protein n=1 Tax=Paenibacillus TaxID=44249 RepID=UPI0021A4DBB6|nr:MULTISPECIES: hypothetical protein [Paenibacillus]MCT2195924.1 hypothetical protein [Paenibacillus sp. p3-SID1389]MEC2346328.1 hypothetical protein [Paenibacillus barengoltzii]